MKRIVSSLLILGLILYTSFFGFAKKAEAAIAVDGTSPSRVNLVNVTGQSTNPLTGTTASFTPPSGAVLVACINADSFDATQDENLTMSNSGTALNWQTVVERDPYEASQGGYAAIAYAVVPTSAAMTVSASVANHGIAATAGTTRGSMKVYAFTGVDTSGPIGSYTEGNSTTNNLTTGSYTSSYANTVGVVCGTDWNALGTPASSDTTSDPNTITGVISFLSGYKSVASSGSSVTFNLDAAGTAAAQWNWASLELMPSGSSASFCAPTYVQESEVSWNTGANKTTSSFNVQAGDVLVAYTMANNFQGGTAPDLTITPSGGSLTWTLQQDVTIANYSYVSIWTARVDTTKSMSVTFTRTGGDSTYHSGGDVLTFRNSTGIGSSAATNVASGAPTLNILTNGAHSAIVVANADINALDGSSRAWRTNAGTFSETTYNLEQFTAYGGYHADAGLANTYAVGLSAPSGQKYSIAAVEVRGTTSGCPVTTASTKALKINGGSRLRIFGGKILRIF